jgi:hypothetical protein
MLICQTCTIRRRCLTESIVPWRFTHALDGPIQMPATAGVLGATLSTERRHVRHLDVDKAVELFENTLTREDREAERRMGGPADPGPAQEPEGSPDPLDPG